MQEPQVAFEEITPARAAELLRSNTRNRRLQLSRVRHYAAEMTKGQWRTTHQGIAVTTDGVLLDGQHRLAAIVEAGVPIRLLVTRGADPDDFKVVDVLRSRSAGDVLHIEGIPQAMTTAAASGC